MDNALKAITTALALLDAATAAYNRARTVIQTARNEGRDVTDAELAALKADSESKLDAFKAQVGG